MSMNDAIVQSTKTDYASINTPAALLRTDGVFLIVDATPATARLLGHDRVQSLLGVSLSTFFPSLAAFDSFHAWLVQSVPRAEFDGAEPLTLTLVDRQGITHLVQMEAQVQKAENGSLMALEASLVDLSAHKAELETLRTSELRLRLLVENAQDIIFNVDTLTTRITALNPAFETVTGWACSEWIGKSFAPLIHPDDLSLALKIVQDAVSEHRASSPFELRLLSRSGRYLTIEFSTAVHQREDEATQWLGIARDITSRKEAEKSTKRYLQRLQALHKIDRAVLLVQSPEEVAFVALNHLANLVACDYANIMILDFGTDEAQIVTEYQGEQLSLSEGGHLHISQMAMPSQFRQGEPNYVPNMPMAGDYAVEQREALLFAWHSITQQPMRSVFNLPLLSRDVMVGILTLASYRPNAFSEEAQEVAGQVANQLAVALQGVRLLEAEQKARHTAETLGTASIALTETLQIDIMLERLLDYLYRLIPFDAARVFLLDPDTEILRLSAIRPPSLPPQSFPSQDLPLMDYPNLARILASGETIVFDDVTRPSQEESGKDQDEGSAQWPHTPTMRSWLAVPLVSQARQLGIYLIEHESTGFFLSQHVRAAKALGAQTAIALANAHLLAERQQYASLLEERVLKRTADLERSRGLIAALSQVATRVQSSLDPQQAIKTLGQELQHLLGVTSMVALLDAPSQTLDIRYFTQDERTVEILSKISVQDSGFPRLTRGHWPLFTDMVDHRRTLFLPDSIMRAYDTYFAPQDPEFDAILTASGITQDVKSIFLPLLIEDRILGVLLLWGEALREIDIPAVTIFGGQIAMALEMARLHAQVQSQRVAEQEALLRLSQALLGEVDVDATNQQALAIVADIFAPDLAAIMLLDETGEQIILQAGLGWPEERLGTVIPLEETSIIAQGLHANRPLVVNDVNAETHFAVPPLMLEQGVVSGINAPMAAGNERLGVLSIYWRTPRPVTGDESRLLALIGNTTAQSIARARLYEAEQKARRVADILRTSNMTLTQSLDLDTVLGTLLTTIQALIPFDSGNVMLLEGESILVAVSARGYERWSNHEIVGQVSFDTEGNEPAARAIRQLKGYVIPDVRQDPSWEWADVGRHVRSWLCMPLIALGKVVGIFSLDKAEPNFFTQEHLQLAETLAAQAASAIQNALLYGKVTEGQERLRVLTRRLVDVQETERSRVARDLHEGVGQYLAGLSLNLKAGTQVGPEGLHRQLVTAKSIVDDLTVQVREMSLALRPTLLDDMGLIPALDWLFERHAKQANQKIDFTHSNLAEQRFDPATETAIFRIIQEILIDLVDVRQAVEPTMMPVSSQADPTTLHIRAWWAEKKLHLMVSDQGPESGLPQALGGEHISNLYSLRERAALLGGHLVFETTEDQSSHITAFFPLPDSILDESNHAQSPQ